MAGKKKPKTSNTNSKPRVGASGIKPKPPNPFRTKQGMVPFGEGKSLDSKRVHGGIGDGASLQRTGEKPRNINSRPKSLMGLALGAMVGHALKKSPPPKKPTHRSIKKPRT